jgi:hypothetical protein
MSGFDERRYQVFVSSTFEDLKDEREKTLQAVLEMKAFPAGMELFPSADEEQWAFIQREIESSDYYVLITAGKYGSPAPDGVSFTEKEYDYAVSLKKYVMSFVRKDLNEIAAGRSEMDPGRRAKLEAFHQKVKRSKLVRFYSTSDELKSEVLQALMHAFRFAPREGWTPARNARRIEDLEELTRLQKRVIELEAENAQLKADPMAAFSQGDDVLTRTLWLAAVRTPQSVVEPPSSSFDFRASWNELLVAVFRGAEAEVSEGPAFSRIRELVSQQISAAFPEAREWLAPVTSLAQGINDFEVTALIKSVKLQFLGLDLIEGARSEHGHQVWRLTRKGRAQMLAVKGVRRSSAAAAE